MTHPAYVAGAIVSGADDRTQRELFGFYVALMSMYAAHPTASVVVEAPLVYAAGGPHTDRLVAQAVEAGYMRPIEVEGRQAWELTNEPAFVHVRTKPELDRDAARKRDNGDVALTLAVQRRDGSQCRYCGVPVTWGDKVGARGGTYDHLDPAKLGDARRPATSTDELVVACRKCNSARGAAHRDGKLAEWDAEHPLRPVPTNPFYCERVKARFAEHGMPLPTAERPATPTDTAPTPERPGTQPGTAGAGERPVAADTAPTPDPPKGTEVNSPGREGQGRAGPGAGPRRRRRGRRGGGDPPTRGRVR